MARESRLRARARSVHDTADDVAGGIACGDGSVGIDRRKLRARVFAAKSVKEPPRYAVHGGHDDRLALEQGRNRCRDAGQRRSLHGDHHQILWSELARLFGDACRHRNHAVASLQAPTVRAQRGSSRAASDCRNLAAALRQPRAEKPPMAPAPKIVTFMLRLGG